MKDGVECTRCKGRGRVPLSTELQATLDFARSHRRGGIMTRELVMRFKGLATSAACNRLSDLVRLGFLTTEWLSHKRRIYIPVKRQA
jgi:hypothetical protein